MRKVVKRGVEARVDRALAAVEGSNVVSVVDDAEAVSARAKEARKRRRGTPAKQLSKAVEEARAIKAAGDWSAAHPRHLVGLYAIAHKGVYGVEPAELESGYLGALSAAKKLVEAEFKGKVVDALDFLGWVWTREEKLEKRRRLEKSESDFRVGWHYMFAGRKLLTDYRVAMRREGSR